MIFLKNDQIKETYVRNTVLKTDTEESKLIQK